MKSALSVLLLCFLLASCGEKKSVKAEEAVETEKTIQERAEADDIDAEAQYELGARYVNGQGVPESYAEAVKWWRKAAEQGHALAQSALGDMYCIGEGVPESYAEAVKWYRKAAEQGDAVGQYNLGAMYSLGAGVQKDMAQATKWIRKAAEQGHLDAKEWLKKNAKDKSE